MRVSLGFIDIHSQMFEAKHFQKNSSQIHGVQIFIKSNFIFYLMTQQHAMNPIYLLFQPKMWIQTKRLNLFVC